MPRRQPKEQAKAAENKKKVLNGCAYMGQFLDTEDFLKPQDAQREQHN